MYQYSIYIRTKFTDHSHCILALSHKVKHVVTKTLVFSPISVCQVKKGVKKCRGKTAVEIN